MLFWIVAGGLAAAVAAALLRPLLRPSPETAAELPERAIYRAQLLEVERDSQRGLVPEGEAERLRTEIARRLLSADRATPARAVEAPARAGLVLAAGAGVALVAGSLLLYAETGSPGMPDEPRAARIAAADALRAARPSQAAAEAEWALQAPPPPEAPADYVAEVERLRQVVPTRPDDMEGWRLLATHEARLGRFADAARAQERVVALKGEGATARDWLDLVDRMVAAAGGLVTPEAENALAEAAALDRTAPGLLYYLGLAEAQVGRPDRAFPIWRRLLETAAADDPYRRPVEAQVADLAWLAGVDYQPPAPPAPGPTEADVAAAADLDPEARARMIGGMVQGLADRLAAEGGPPEDWARLVGALGVLGEADRARAILAEARTTFAGDENALAALDAAARQAGLE